MKVCEKVQAKGSTSYNEVADELVNELTDPRYVISELLIDSICRWINLICRSIHTALYKVSKLTLRFPHQFDRKKNLNRFENF